jgi:hypothetical protein
MPVSQENVAITDLGKGTPSPGLFAMSASMADIAKIMLDFGMPEQC